MGHPCSLESVVGHRTGCCKASPYWPWMSFSSPPVCISLLHGCAIFSLASFWVFILACHVEGAISEEVPVLMEFPTSEQYVLIVNGL
jgi:hypothetical protein